MRNQQQNEMEEVLYYLNSIAEMFERKLLDKVQFRYYISGSLNYAATIFTIDRFEEKLLRDQAYDIGEGLYTRFSSPTMDASEVEHYHNENE